MNIYILCGGISPEHEISLRSAQSIINNIDRTKYNVKIVYITKEGKFSLLGDIKEVQSPDELIVDTSLSKEESIKEFIDDSKDTDYVIPCIHGLTGEDGKIQGFLEILGLKYVGNDLLSSAVCMDKAVTNEILDSNNINQAKYRVLRIDEYENMDKNTIWKYIENNIGKSVFVKPANNGSSVGVNRADEKNIIEALDEAFIYDTKVLIEEEIIGIELEISVFGNENPKASLPGSYTTDRKFFDYTAKYNDPKLIRNVPHKLSSEKTKEIQELAEETYKILGCSGFSRIDIFMDDEENFYVNEVNTFPGMTQSSLTADLWKATNNTPYSKLIDNLIEFAIERYEKLKNIKLTR